VCAPAEQALLDAVAVTAHRHLLQGAYGGGSGGAYGSGSGRTPSSGSGGTSESGGASDGGGASDSGSSSDAGSAGSAAAGRAKEGRGTTPCTQLQMLGKLACAHITMLAEIVVEYRCHVPEPRDPCEQPVLS
jgi:hypothetical protein